MTAVACPRPTRLTLSAPGPGRQVSQRRPLLDQVNQAGPQLSQISPGDGAQTIESLVTRDNRRFEAIAEQVQRKAERLRQARQRHGEVVIDIDELLDWFKQVRCRYPPLRRRLQRPARRSAPGPLRCLMSGWAAKCAISVYVIETCLTAA